MAINDERCLVVRHEDLIAKPVYVLSLMLDHLRLRHDDTFLQNACGELRPSVDRRPELPARQLEAIRTILNDILLAFGYDN